MRTVLLATILTVLVAAGAHAALFSDFVIFGDSLSDNGNAYIGTGGLPPAPVPPAYTLGRFTDGSSTIPAGTPGGIWHEVLAGLLGEPVAEPFLPPFNGTNYAVGGAQVLTNTSVTVPTTPTPTVVTIPSLTTQVGLYLTSVNDHPDPNALYIFWGGANDLYTAAETPGETPAEITATESAMATALYSDIAGLAALGARDFLWLNLPQLASTPRGMADIANAPSLATAFTNASAQFQTDVATDSALLNLLPAVQVVPVDIYSLYQNILNDPAAYGYTNVTGYAQGNPSANPDQYVFWDFDSHATTTGHKLIAEVADAAIVSTFTPEPATWAIAGAGLLTVLWRRRRA